MSFTHPRRTPKTILSSVTPTAPNASARTSEPSMRLRKGATFHSPSAPEFQGLSRVPSLPRRSQTTLDDVVDGHERRIALQLEDIDRGLASFEVCSPTRKHTFRDESDPVPQGFLHRSIECAGSPAASSYGAIMDGVLVKQESSPPPVSRRLRPRHTRLPSRYADSGLGSSIQSSAGKKAAEESSSIDDGRCSTTAVNASAITGSAAHSPMLPRLSSRATSRIHEYILKPLLAKKSLADFHPVVKDIPRRMHAKEIVCLRDLEKTLVFMAPERAKSAALYLDFCISSIRCIQATVEFLGEREQTRPSDRPYTNGYFVDLVDQIKQYAQQVQAAKEREEKGESVDEMDAHRTDEVRLHGGLLKTGRPAELIRVRKDGTAISIATGKTVDLNEDDKTDFHTKRSLSEEAEDDESVMRSMARRKRSPTAAELAPKRCREPGCDKHFKRPCDLTKHEKTHSRPWKCPVEDCKYHEYGWPTEKEMDRHHNDKHSAAPPLYECHFKPCPYRSKRESNCKQHMEKAHGWTYVRSKNNGKIKDDASISNGLPTPQLTNVPSPGNESTSILTPSYSPDDNDLFGDNTVDHNPNFSSYSPDAAAPSIFLGLTYNPGLHPEYSPITDHVSSGSVGRSPYDTLTMTGHGQFQDIPEFPDAMDFELFADSDNDLYNANAQFTTDADAIQHVFAPYHGFETSGVPYGVDPLPHISPGGHASTMLYTPVSMLDESFVDSVPLTLQDRKQQIDFPLFPSNSAMPMDDSMPMFGHISNAQSGLSTSVGQSLLDFYEASTNAARTGHCTANMSMDQEIDWSAEYTPERYTSEGHFSGQYNSEDQFSSY